MFFCSESFRDPNGGLAEIMKQLLIIQVQVIVTLIQILILSNPSITSNLREQQSGTKKQTWQQELFVGVPAR